MTTEKAEAGRIKLYLTADLTVATPELDDATKTIAWTNWDLFGNLVDDCTVQLVEEAEDIMPLDVFFRTIDVINHKGIENINCTLATRDADSIFKAISSSVSVAGDTIAAGASQVGKTIVHGGLSAQTTYRRAGIEFLDDDDFWCVLLINKVRAIGDWSLLLNHEATKIPVNLKAFNMTAAEATAASVADDDRCWVLHDMTAEKTA